MGCDWYDFTAMTGTGKVYLTKNRPEPREHSFIFNAKHSEYNEEKDGCSCGVDLIYPEEEEEEVTEWLVVNFDEKPITISASVPGPYEIEKEYRYANVEVKGNNILLTSTMDLSIYTID